MSGRHLSPPASDDEPIVYRGRKFGKEDSGLAVVGRDLFGDICHSVGQAYLDALVDAELVDREAAQRVLEEKGREWTHGEFKIKKKLVPRKPKTKAEVKTTDFELIYFPYFKVKSIKLSEPSFFAVTNSRSGFIMAIATIVNDTPIYYRPSTRDVNLIGSAGYKFQLEEGFGYYA